MTSCTAARLRPNLAIADLSTLMSSTERPLACSTFTSVAPRVLRRISAAWFAVVSSCCKSSPKIFTATSPRTPAKSSLKRIWIGWVNS